MLGSYDKELFTKLFQEHSELLPAPECSCELRTEALCEMLKPYELYDIELGIGERDRSKPILRQFTVAELTEGADKDLAVWKTKSQEYYYDILKSILPTFYSSKLYIYLNKYK